MYNIYNTISDIDIDNGQTKRMNCPNCNGYMTFSVTNNMGHLLWNCYKASCNVSGSKQVRLSVDDIRTTFSGNTNKPKDTVFELPSSVVTHGNRKEILEWTNDWGIDASKLNLLYDAKENRVVFPVVQDNIMVDATGRSLSNRLPKWKRYGNSGLPYSYGCGNVAVVVEDCVSAAVVGDRGVFVGVAVLGTSLSEEHKRYLSQFSTAIIALDPDALPKTLAFAKELRGHVNTVKVLRLEDDLKYRNPTDMTNLDNTGEI